MGIVAVEALAAVFGHRHVGLSLTVLILAPGLTLTALLPDAMRSRLLAVVAAAPVLGFAASAVAIISSVRLGLPVEPWPMRAIVGGVCLLGLVTRAPAIPVRPSWREVGGLMAALTVGLLLQSRVIGETPVPGNDWAKYVLYADEIRRQGSLLIDNPFWMLGVPFREDPATPAVYGAALAMSGASAAGLAQGIWAFALMGILAVFALVRSFWGPAAACLAAALYAVIPVNHDILGWHGLANVAALPLLAVALAYAIAIARGEARERSAVGLALVLVALVATHRLTATVGLASLFVVAVPTMVFAVRAERLRLVKGWAITAASAACLAVGVAADLLTRHRSSGGIQDAQAYAATRIDFGPAVRDLTVPFVIAGIVALSVLVTRHGRDRRLWPLFGLGLVTIALAFSWVIDFPLAYLRMVYFLPLALAPVTAVWLAATRPGRLSSIVLLAVMVVLAWNQAANVRTFYAFSDSASLRGLDAVARQLRPGDVVVTDRCWSFLTTWLLQTPMLAALGTEDIGPAAELPLARRARSILSGTPEGLRDARALGVRYLLTDPTCVDAHEEPLPAPTIGEAVYVSRRLVVLEVR